MEEIKRTVTPSNLYNDFDYKFLYLWAVHRLPSMKILYTISSLVIAYMMIQIIAILIKFKVFLYKDLFLLVVAIIYLYIFLPYIKFLISRKKTVKAFGKTYDILLNKTGIKINCCFIPWPEKHRVLECKYGIVIISFNKILAILSKNCFSDEEFHILKKWIGIF